MPPSPSKQALLKGKAQATAGMQILKSFIMQMAHLLLLSWMQEFQACK